MLLGERVSAFQKVISPGYYSDLPTAFVHILEDLNKWMPSTLPHLPDPSGANNDFNHRWDQDSYDNLRAKVKVIAEAGRAALDASSREESLELWQSLFGADFKKPASKTASIVTPAVTIPRTVRAGRDG